jgi:hypothetical protein
MRKLLLFLFVAFLALVGTVQAAVTYVNNSYAYQYGVGSISISPPSSCQNGDVLIANIVWYFNGGAITNPSGWTTIGSNQSFYYTSCSINTCWHVYSSSDTTYTWTSASSSGSLAGEIMAFRGASNTTPINQTVQYNSDSTTGTAITTNSGITTNANGCMIILTVGGYTNHVTTSTFAAGGNAMTQAYDLYTDTSCLYCIGGGGYWLQSTKGALTAGIAVASSNCAWGCTMIALQPPAVTTPTGAWRLLQSFLRHSGLDRLCWLGTGKVWAMEGR